MKVSNIKIHPINNERNTKLKAFASAVFNDEFVINNMRIIDNGKRLFVAMPSTRLDDGRFIDLVFPINQDVRKIVEEAILAEYNAKAGAQ